MAEAEALDEGLVCLVVHLGEQLAPGVVETLAHALVQLDGSANPIDTAWSLPVRPRLRREGGSTNRVLQRSHEYWMSAGASCVKLICGLETTRPGSVKGRRKEPNQL